MPEIDEKLDKLVAGVEKMNKAHTELENATGTAQKDAEIKLENIKKDVEKIVLDAQTEKQELVAKITEQKESFDLLQKEFIERGNAGGNGDEMKQAFKEYNEHLACYFKSKTPIPGADIEAICRDLAKKSVYGVKEGDVDHEMKTLVAGSNVDGGFFLTTDRSSTMSTRIFETSPIRPLANIVTTTSDMWETILDDGEPDAGWVGEVTARPTTDTAEIGLIKIPVQELYAKPKATQKMIDDAGFDIVSWHQGKVTRKFGRMENSAFTVGNGSARPKGFLTYAAWAAVGTYQRDAVEQVTSATTAVIVADDLINLQSSLIADYEIMSQWAMNRNTLFNNVFTLKDTQGQYLINPRLISEGGQMVLLGRPVNLFEDMVNVTNSSLSIALADWSEFYTIVDRMGIRVLRNPYSEEGYVRFYTTKRVGGGVTNYEAGKILKTKA